MSLLGIGGSSSSTKKYTTYNTTTQTESNVGDIGITGANAVDLAAVIQAGGGVMAQQTQETVRTLAQSTGEGFQSFVGGVSHVTDETQETTRDLISTLGDVVNNVVYNVTDLGRKAFNLGESSLDTSGQVITAERAGPTSLLAQNLPIIAIAGVVALIILRKK